MTLVLWPAILVTVVGCGGGGETAQETHTPPKQLANQPREPGASFAGLPRSPLEDRAEEGHQTDGQQDRLENQDDFPGRVERGPAWQDPTSGIDIERLEAAGIRAIKGQHSWLLTDVRGRSDIDSLPQVLDAAFPQLCRLLGIPPERVADWRLVGCVMADDARFTEVGLVTADMPTFPAGYQRGHRIWVYIQPGEYYTRHLWLHEAMHALMREFLGGTGPPWYAEGMAEVAGLHRWDGEQVQIAVSPRSPDEVPFWGRVGVLRDDIANGRAMTLSEVLEIDFIAFREVRLYAWSWAACEFLRHHPLSADAFSSLAQHVALSSAEFNDRLRQSLLAQWPQLELDWKLMLHRMDYGYDVARASIVAVDPIVERVPLTESRRASIAADRGWQSTGIWLQAGVTYQITAEGRYQVAEEDSPWISEPDGVTIQYYAGQPLGKLLVAVHDPDNPLDDSPGSMFDPLAVGSGRVVAFQTSGVLMARINDDLSRLDDNRGTAQVQVAPLEN